MTNIPDQCQRDDLRQQQELGFEQEEISMREHEEEIAEMWEDTMLLETDEYMESLARRCQDIQRQDEAEMRLMAALKLEEEYIKFLEKNQSNLCDHPNARDFVRHEIFQFFLDRFNLMV